VVSRQDILDQSIVDAVELASDGTTSIFLGADLVSTTSATRTVVLVTGAPYLINGDTDEIVEAGDRVTLSGTSGGAADGTYTVESVTDDDTLIVVEAIADSTGGTLSAFHPVGASKVGFDPTGLTNTTATNVQEALEDIDAAVSSGGITEPQHEDLYTLAHDEVRTSFDESVYTGVRLSGLITWTDAGKTQKIREITWTYTGTRVTQIVTKQYDASGVLQDTLTEDITYVGVTRRVDSITRTRTS
jgi:hypothetical protein